MCTFEEKGLTVCMCGRESEFKCAIVYAWMCKLHVRGKGADCVYVWKRKCVQVSSCVYMNVQTSRSCACPRPYPCARDKGGGSGYGTECYHIRDGEYMSVCKHVTCQPV